MPERKRGGGRRSSGRGTGGKRSSAKRGAGGDGRSSGPARRQTASRAPEADANGGEGQTPRSFWSGTIAFGLVSVPVQLFVANRNTSVALRMVDDDGVPLKRRYVCSAEARELENDEIVRGYEIEKDRYVIVEDEELEALAPEKSREIDLDRFVPLDELDPIFFDRAYFLAPDREAVRAYRLLASIMEDSGRAGIATFVMRGKEYLIAILAEQGLLRAETLRFEDELRTPADAGLPDLEGAEAKRRSAIDDDIAELERDTFDRETLADPYRERLRKLVRAKLDADVDVVAAPEDAEVEASATVVDLMQVLKRSLEGAEKGGAAPRKGPSGAKKAGGRARGRENLENRSKQALYERAQALEIEGRSGMTKQELVDAIRAAG